MAESDEYITPKKYVDAARHLMGKIDLDPATTKLANEQIVQANKYWTKEDNFFSKGNLYSHDTIWLNPPYSNAQPFVHKVLRNWQRGFVDESVILIHCCPSNRWFQKFWSCPICFVSPRISFLKNRDGELVPQKDNRYDNLFIYLPSNSEKVLKFQSLFDKFGRVTNIFPWLDSNTLKKAKTNARLD